MISAAILAREEGATTVPPPPPSRGNDTRTTPRDGAGAGTGATPPPHSRSKTEAFFLGNAPTPVGPFHDATPSRPFFDCHAPREEKTAKFFELTQKRNAGNGGNGETAANSPGSSWSSDLEHFFCRDRMDDTTGEEGASTSYRIDPHASWWNGKVGLYEILRGQVCRRIRRARGHEPSSHPEDARDATTPGIPDGDLVADPANDGTAPPDPTGGARCRSTFVEREASGSVEDLISINALDGRVRVQVHLESGILVALLAAFVAHYLYLLFVVYRRRRKDADDRYFAADAWAKGGDRIADGQREGAAEAEMVRNLADRDGDRMAVPPSVAAASMMSALSLLEGDSSSSEGGDGDSDKSEDDELDVLDRLVQLDGLDGVAQELSMPEDYPYHHVQNAQELSLDAVGPVVPCRNVPSSALDDDDLEVTNVVAAPQCGDDGDGDNGIGDLYICLATEVPIKGGADDGRAAARRAEIDAAHNVWVSRMRECGEIEVVAGPHPDDGELTPHRRRLLRAVEASATQWGRNAGESPRDGTMILRAASLEEAHAVAGSDPYHEGCVCTYRVMPLEVPSGPS